MVGLCVYNVDVPRIVGLCGYRVKRRIAYAITTGVDGDDGTVATATF